MHEAKTDRTERSETSQLQLEMATLSSQQIDENQ